MTTAVPEAAARSNWSTMRAVLASSWWLLGSRAMVDDWTAGADATLAERIERLEAKDEIRELTARYCHAVVDGDVEAIVELFCGDGTFRMRKFAATGDEELREMYAGGIGGKTHKPFIQNHVIDLVSPTEATGRCSVEIRVFQDDQALTAAGHYHDAYRKENGRWRFAERFYNSYHLAPWSTGWTK